MTGEDSALEVFSTQTFTCLMKTFICPHPSENTLTPNSIFLNKQALCFVVCFFVLFFFFFLGCFVFLSVPNTAALSPRWCLNENTAF